MRECLHAKVHNFSGFVVTAREGDKVFVNSKTACSVFDIKESGLGGRGPFVFFWGGGVSKNKINMTINQANY